MMRGLLRSNREVLILCVATALLTMGQGIAVPIVPLYADTLGVSVAQVGLVITAFGLARFLTNMPAAITSDRFGRRSILIGGALISALGNVLSGFATSLEPLLVYRFIAGIGSAAFITGAVIFIADVSNPTNRGRLMSLFQGSFVIGITAGPGMGGLLAEIFGLRGPFIAVGVVSLLSAIWAFLQVPETRWRSRGEPLASTPPAVATTEGPDETPVAEEAKPPPVAAGRWMRYAFLKRKDFLLISLTFAGTFFTRGGAMFTILPLKASRQLGLSPGQIGGLLTIPSALTFLMLPVVGFVSDRFGRKSAIVPGVGLFAVAMVVLGVSTGFMVYALGMVLYGIAQGLEGPAPVAYVSDISPREGQAIAQGAARTLGDLALLSAPPLMGLTSDLWGTTPTLFANGALMAVIALAFWMFASDPARDAAREARRRRAAELGPAAD